MISVINNR